MKAIAFCLLLAACPTPCERDPTLPECQSNTEMPPPPKVTFAEVMGIFEPIDRCGRDDCHGKDMPKPSGRPLLLVGSGACSDLKDASAWPMVPEQYQKRVVPFDRSRSFLYKKLLVDNNNDKDTMQHGRMMPLGGMRLDAETIEKVGLWIDQGAVCP